MVAKRDVGGEVEAAAEWSVDFSDAPDGSDAAVRRIAGQRCPLCGAEGVEVGAKDGLELRVCCESVLSWGWTSEAEYEAWYWDAHAYHVEEQRRNGQRPFVERFAEQAAAADARLAVLRAYGIPAGEAQVLDIGAGTGAFLEVAQNRYGYLAAGIEPCGALVQWARGRGLNLHQGDWRSASGRYTLITMFDVLEHLTRPGECLAHLGACLAPDGLLAVEMPEWGSPDQREHGLQWRHVRPRQHLWLPSRGAAEALFERCGYQVMAFYRPLRGTLGKATWFLAIGGE